MSKRCELQKEYYQQHGNYKGNGKYCDKYVSWLEEQILALRIHDVMAMLPTAMINRVEVIDENGRSYVNWKPTNRTELQVQDNGRTLKIFVSQGN
jgi:hypothetical protein